MTSLDRLKVYLVEAIKRTTAKEYRKVSAALIPALPNLVETLSQVIADDTTTSAQRLQAADMLMCLWARCIRDEGKKQRATLQHQQLKVKAKKVAVEQTKTALKVHQVRAETDKKLAAMEGE
jgi:hypothetical protein